MVQGDGCTVGTSGEEDEGKEEVEEGRVGGGGDGDGESGAELEVA